MDVQMETGNLFDGAMVATAVVLRLPKMRRLSEHINHNALRLAIDRMGELVDDLHRSAEGVEDDDERKTRRLAADYVSDQRKDLQRLLR